MLEDVLDCLDSAKGSHKQVARDSGVPYSTVAKIAQRVTPNPGVNHVQRLYEYFQALHGRKDKDS